MTLKYHIESKLITVPFSRRQQRNDRLACLAPAIVLRNWVYRCRCFIQGYWRHRT